jgi:hypothetical protein
MDESAEPVVAANRALVPGAEWNDLRRGLGRAQVERPVGALAVVVVDVLAQDALELAAADDEQPVEALLAQGADEALSVRALAFGALSGRADNRDPLGPEDLVEPGAELRIAVVDQTAQRPRAIAGFDHEVADVERTARPFSSVTGPPSRA